MTSTYIVKYPEARDRVYRNVEASSPEEAEAIVRAWRADGQGDDQRAWPDEFEDLEGDIASGNGSLDVYVEEQA